MLRSEDAACSSNPKYGGKDPYYLTLKIHHGVIMDDITPGHQRYVGGEISAFDYVDKSKVNIGDLGRFCEEMGYGGVKRFYRFDSFKKFREITMETDLLLAIDRHKKREVHIWLVAEKTANRSVGDGGVSVGDGGVVVGDGGVPVGDGDRSVPVGDGDRSVLEDEGDQSVDEDFCASRDTDSGFDDILFEEYVEAEECVEGPKQKENQHEVDDEMSTDSSSSNDSDEQTGKNEETESNVFNKRHINNPKTCEWKKLAESGLQDGAFDMEAEAEAEELTQGDEFPPASLFSASQPQSQPQSQMSATTSRGARKGTKEAASSMVLLYLFYLSSFVYNVATETKVPARGKALIPTDLSIAIPPGTYARVGKVTQPLYLPILYDHLYNLVIPKDKTFNGKEIKKKNATFGRVNFTLLLWERHEKTNAVNPENGVILVLSSVVEMVEKGFIDV
ncbi:deoxyuridine 5'-triphosphate nucleotidohydrolase [Striga asiatica]|uniref:Deoxyuridine 5'-triphosphate nucleotidohydrolase n=1 Tax=Striga asiatica TaxID=4170 RepID=A0A5A7QXE7_STRAF|nr:deoxyuridine 5'-triphosphate nucleotidohydrolase [Striga asiatica]